MTTPFDRMRKRLEDTEARCAELEDERVALLGIYPALRLRSLAEVGELWKREHSEKLAAELERDTLRQVLVELREWADYHRPNRIWADQVSDEIDRRLAALEREEPKP